MQLAPLTMADSKPMLSGYWVLQTTVASITIDSSQLQRSFADFETMIDTVPSMRTTAFVNNDVA